MACWISSAFASVKVNHYLLHLTNSSQYSAENDTLARIGTSCLQQLLENNVNKLSAARWERVTTTFVRLFRTTTPYQLFDESLRVEIDSPSDSAESNPGNASINSQANIMLMKLFL